MSGGAALRIHENLALKARISQRGTEFNLSGRCIPRGSDWSIRPRA
jgi:hypothetical protein